MLSGTDPRRVGVAGAGLMGSGIAAVLARAGCDVTVYDVDAGVLGAAVRRLGDDGLRVGTAAGVEDLARGSDLVIEAVAENLPLKQELFAALDHANSGGLLATNTSVLPVTAIASRTREPGRVVGTHWWNPPHLIPVVEVVRGRHTSDATMDRTVAFLRRLGKTPVRVEKDVPGFVGNRLQHALWREAIALVADGVCDAATVDLVVRNTIGLRLAEMGPIENADYVGLDLTLAIHEAVLGALNSDPDPSPLLRRLVTAGQLGAKAGRGFLDWPAGAREAAARRLSDHVTRQLRDRDARPST
ncbi:MAG: 3-hydroxybutyryl-CoA dehydrogenase [Micromonosporaceae bacterium]